VGDMPSPPQESRKTRVERESRDAMGSRQAQYRGLAGTMQADYRHERHNRFEKFLRSGKEGLKMERTKNGGSPAGPRTALPACDGDNTLNYGIELGL
jgi:hypothetical protein